MGGKRLAQGQDYSLTYSNNVNVGTARVTVTGKGNYADSYNASFTIFTSTTDAARGHGVQYRTHVQNDGWQDWKSNGAMSGTSGRALRLEAIQIQLTGDVATKYDVYYRVHCQNFGWMGWAKNGESAGSAGFAYRLEGIEIRLVPKGGSAPGSTYGAFRQR